MASDGMDPAEAIAPMWQNFLQGMTAQGASRKDILSMALNTCAVVLDSTASAMWPEGQGADTQEEAARILFRNVADSLRERGTALQ
jgi:hypothetical protein